MWLNLGFPGIICPAEGTDERGMKEVILICTHNIAISTALTFH